MRIHALRLLIALFGLVALAHAMPARAAKDIDCEMRFSMHGWSAFYKTATGSGTVTCNNGSRMNVRIRAKGGGLTFGKSTLENGRGEFSGVRSIREVLGTYAEGEAHAGAAKSADAQVMTKGDVNLALSGKGRGWDLGVAFGKFVITQQ